MNLQRKDWFGLGLLLMISMLMLPLTTHFSAFGKLQIPAVLFTSLLSGLPLITWLQPEMVKAWHRLTRKNRAIGLAIPGFLLSVFLLGPLVDAHGTVFGIVLTMLVSSCGSILFWMPTLISEQIELMAKRATFLTRMFDRRRGLQYESGLSAKAEMDRRHQRRPPQ
jgi:hypothetical protein